VYASGGRAQGVRDSFTGLCVDACTQPRAGPRHDLDSLSGRRSVLARWGLRALCSATHPSTRAQHRAEPCRRQSKPSCVTRFATCGLQRQIPLLLFHRRSVAKRRRYCPRKWAMLVLPYAEAERSCATTRFPRNGTLRLPTERCVAPHLSWIERRAACRSVKRARKTHKDTDNFLVTV
jgi:hypothetical protein